MPLAECNGSVRCFVRGDMSRDKEIYLTFIYLDVNRTCVVGLLTQTRTRTHTHLRMNVIMHGKITVATCLGPAVVLRGLAVL